MVSRNPDIPVKGGLANADKRNCMTNSTSMVKTVTRRPSKALGSK